MFLLESDNLSRFELFGEDAYELLQTIESSFWVKFTEGDVVSAVDIRTLTHCVSKKLMNPILEQL
jgi:hypothetical protein